MEDSSAFAAFQPDDSERTPEHRGRKRPLTEPQRKAKNERDRKYRQEHRVEFERLQNVGSQCDDLKTQLGMQTNTISELEEENQRLKNRESHLNKRIEELENALLERAAPTNQKSWENLGWSPVNVGSIQDLAPSGHTGSSCGAQAKFPIKFLLWNSVGTLDTYGQRVVMDLINRFRPAVLVIAETKLPRDRAEEIKDTFHFDAHHVPPNLEFVGGMWLLWRSDVVEVEVLSFTEQEIHARINGSHFKSIKEIELSDWEEKRAKKVEEQNSEVRKDCPRYAEYFQGKSLSAGLLH
ncbi:hypothetical protein SCA6_005492 [Theobroma cacao]